MSNILILNCEKCNELKHKRYFMNTMKICKTCSKNKDSFSKSDKEELIQQILKFKEKLK